MPAFLNVVDIAGLVKGAAEGQGLGNAFLSHISACDAIFHLCSEFKLFQYPCIRSKYCELFLGAFDDDDVTHIEGEVNPVRDLDIIGEELRLKDVEFLNGFLEKLEKLVVRGNDKKSKPEYVSRVLLSQLTRLRRVTFVLRVLRGLKIFNPSNPDFSGKFKCSSARKLARHFE